MELSRYKDDILEKYKRYNPVLHTPEEKDFGYYTIELINNNGNNLYINLEDEITITYGEWHCHYYCEDDSDIEDALEKVNNILNNIDCNLIIYSNGKYFGSGSTLNKGKYTKEEVVEYIKSFLGDKEFVSTFKNNGASIRFEFWDSSKNYEMIIEKEMF